ncbi:MULTISPECIES: S-adenosyl-l-methionine hydroxide adenosyltransferase family protein [Bacillus]|uniref:DNA-directed RNA polymerase subunit delta n=1 Tax=Bacillus glycinifermentans TaxID=1664069 RepID=A0AAJ4D4V3_9BACI|nr:MULTISPECIES: S-adenosyl-l-methionine hydroxide adenosyltransferase family protein [Bacillus]KKB74069.1 DNA-directed RNA polymerase subunit delta [Bacillus sp. TH008]MBU8786223.1 S-adenosyl-l-methionine hydroxide adenosyltransferase family protein [Bacillus glycinifermentans]MDU0070168.1 S-adenosyl-l-methionine hydroxide adenosyltransferase family protein [Bacillus sp. IG6]MED8017898.1 S-adenosyl-l-methionine hydroxide adenosyltransferase family protein [Bacillus glycinifermentans]QAT67677.
MSRNALVLQSDFGIDDGAVNAMYGVAYSVDSSIRIFDVTHNIPVFHIWEASYRLLQTVSYWPEGTVFVSVVDPGVGSERRSVAVRTSSNQYIITPDNGTLTHVVQKNGIAEARHLDEALNRLPNSGESHTFHGRDIYAYTGARLASGAIRFDQIGPEVSPDSLIKLPVMEAYIDHEWVAGTIDILDIRFGNLWTNISRRLFSNLDIRYGDAVEVVITHGINEVYRQTIVFGRSFADIPVGEPLVYVNSLDNLGVAINQGSFAETHHIGTGIDWRISIRKAG